MAKLAKMSIGAPVANIPAPTRKLRRTRLDVVRRALMKTEPGTILPVYTGSAPSAANLATMLRKAGTDLVSTIAVRKHIVYVQRGTGATSGTTPGQDAVRQPATAASGLTAAV